MLYWSKNTSLSIALALSAATFTSLPATAGTHSPAADEPVEAEKSSKESDQEEKESDDVLEAALKKSFSDSQLARIEKLKTSEKDALSKVALQLKEKKEKKSSKDWREDLPKEAELTEKELAEAKKFIEKEYRDDPENYELRQMAELLSEEEDRILAKKSDEQKLKDSTDDAWAGLSSLTKSTTENLTKLGSTIQEGWNKLSTGEKTAATIGGAVALNTVVPGAGSLLLGGLGTAQKTGSETSPQGTTSSASSSGTHSGATGSSTASVPSAEKPSTETPSSTSSGTTSSTTDGETPSTSSTPVVATKPTPASTSTASTGGTTSTNNGITTTPKAQTSTSPASTGTTSLPSITSTPKPETPATTSNPASQTPVENPVSTASTPSQQLPTFTPQTMDGILEKTKHFPTASLSNLSTGNFMGHEGKYGSAGGTSISTSGSTSNSSSNTPYSSAIGNSGSDDVFAENKLNSETTTSRLDNKRPEASPNGSPSGAPQPVAGSGENGNADTTASNLAGGNGANGNGTTSGGRDSNSDYTSGSGSGSYAQNGSSKKFSSPKDNSDWNYRSEDRGVNDGPVSRGNQLQWDESAQVGSGSTNAGVERVKEVLGESNSYSKNAEYGPDSSDESYSDFARRISEESGGRGLADNEGAESALEKPGDSAKRASGQSELGEDETFVSLELGYNVEDVLSEVKKSIQSNGKPKKPGASQVMRSQFAYVNGSSKSDLTAFKESAIKPRF